ncbi:hypothetical protein LIS02_004843 [Escherichia coli]|nr:hypothetical protein [Escherichia coli]
MTDAIITDNERINIEPKDVMVKGSNKKQGVNAQTSTQRRPEHQGMAKVIINPGTPDFNRFLTARNGAVIRGFDDVSIAISSLFKTVDAVKHPDLVQAIQDWFNELHEENNKMKENLVAYIKSIEFDKNDSFMSSTQFVPFSFEPVQLNFNNHNTMRFYKYIFEMNQLMNTMYEYNSLGLLAVSDYPVMSHNIIKSINLYVENVKKTLNVSRHKDGPYSPAEFITKVMQYKSVQAYIAAELSGKRR